jgi:hypothetical protein
VLDVIGVDATTGAVIYGRTGGGGLAEDPTDFGYVVATKVLSVGAASGGAISVGDAAAGDTTSYGQWNAGSTAAVSPANTGRMRYNQALQQFEVSHNGLAYVPLGIAGAPGTLDQAYDSGGAGAGRAILTDAGAVTMTNTAADVNNVLELTKNPAAPQAGNALDITMGAQTTGAAINVTSSGTGGYSILQSGATLVTATDLPVDEAISLGVGWPDDRIEAADLIGYHASVGGPATTAPHANVLSGAYSQPVNFNANQNTQNWTATVGVRAFDADGFLRGTAVMTGYAGYYARDVTLAFGGGSLTNQYGVYCEPLDGATNNYGVYIKGGTGDTINTHFAMEGSTSGVLSQTVPAVVTDYELTWPAADAAGALTSDGAGTLSWGASGLTVNTTPIAAGTAQRILFESAGNVLTQSAGLAYSDVSGLLLAQVVNAGGVPRSLQVIQAANTAITASTETNGVIFDFGATQEWATGALGFSRSFFVTAPTYAFVGASVLSNAITMHIEGAPSTGANATFDNSIAFLCEAESTLVSAAGLNSGAIAVNDYTVTLTGNTQMTGLPSITGIACGAITVSDAVAITVDAASAVYINSAPVGGGVGPATITESWSLWVDNDVSRLDDGILFIERASESITVAGTQGHLWCKNDNPSGIYWTNDDDNTIRLDRLERSTVTVATYTHLVTDQWMGCNRAGAIQINLVTAAVAKEGYWAIVKDESGNASTNNITINANGLDVIDGAGTYVLNVDYGSVNIYCTGTTWYIW